MIIDMHCDTIHKIWKNGYDLANDRFMLTIDKMKNGGYSVQNFALFVEQEEGIDCYERVTQLLDTFHKQMEMFSDKIVQVTNVDEIKANEAAKKLSAFLTVEGGEACHGDISKLHFLYEQGVRMMTLTWNYPNELGYPNINKTMTDNKDFSPYIPNASDGLTDTGIEFVNEMERLGMIIDVSHLSDAGFYDVYANTKKPFVASHSNAREICPFVRNLTDDMIKKLGERGGVTGLNYCRDFVFTKDEEDAIDNGVSKKSEEEYMMMTCDKLAEHAKHIVNVGGMDVLGLGSDFDGISAYTGMPRADRLDYLAGSLEKYGFTQDQIDDIFYNNVFRVYSETLKSKIL